MTQQKSLKRRVRARMEKTGERYTAARRQVLAKATIDPPIDAVATDPGVSTVAPAPGEQVDAAIFRGEKSASDDALVGRTGHPWSAWRVLLDSWGAADRPHPEIARWLNREHGVDGWWAQELTVKYEMAIGRRQPGQRPDGYSVSTSKTVGVPVERLFDAFTDESLRAGWLREGSLRLRTATRPRTARFDWEDGTTRIAAGFTAKGEARSSVALEHSRLPDAAAAEAARTAWRDRLTTLQHLLESEA